MPIETPLIRTAVLRRQGHTASQLATPDMFIALPASPRRRDADCTSRFCTLC